MFIREFVLDDLPQMIEIWNEVVRESNAFPQENVLGLSDAADFFQSQSFSGVAVEGDKIVGIYVLHPNNVGRCGHLANASYAVKSGIRGKHIGRELVCHCMEQAKILGFRILQFNAVVASNAAAIHLYEDLGFTKLGIVPGGFRLADNQYEDIILFYIEL